MCEGQQAPEMGQALVLFRQEDPAAFDRAIEALEEIGGSVLMSFVPHAIVAALPEDRIDELRCEPSVQSVDTEEIAEERMRAASESGQLAMAAWNEHLTRQSQPQEPPSLGLAWDAPGRLPPDPPSHIQEMLRRRERDMQDGADDEAPS